MVRGDVRRLALMAGTLAAVFAYPSGAGAATLGETFAPGLCEEDTVYLGGPDGSSYEVPRPGVITSWSYEASDPTQARFKVGAPRPGNRYRIVGESTLESVTPGSLNTFPTQVPVRAGQFIGIYISALAGCARPGPTDGLRFAPTNGDHPVGSTPLFESQDFDVDVSALLVTKKCKGRAPTMAGTAGDDILRGTPEKDVIVGLDGNDTIKGLGDKDRLCGNRGSDTLRGGRGNDRLKGGLGRDALNGGRDRDECIGGSGADTARRCEIERSI